MKILQTATYISVDGAFGGPVSVAKAQSAELARLGNDVTLLAGSDGIAQPEVSGARVRLPRVAPLLPATRFSLLWSTRLERAVSEAVQDADIVHCHFARDLVSSRVARAAIRHRRPLILQTHGMLGPDRRIAVRMFDRMTALQGAIEYASRVYALTQTEVEDLERLGVPVDKIAKISNAVSVAESGARQHGDGPSEVLFLARLHPRKRAVDFARMAIELLDRGVNARFSVVGPDEGDMDNVKRLVDASQYRSRISVEGPVSPEHAKARLSRASVYVLPSIGEVVPMGALEASSLGVPVVLSSDCGLAGSYLEFGAGLVAQGDYREYANAVELVLRNPEAAVKMGERGREMIRECFSVEALGRFLITEYRDVLER